jgi:hypothetical protein
MQRRCNKEIKRQQTVVAMLCQAITDWTHRTQDDSVLEEAVQDAIDAIPAAEAIMGWRDELTFVNNKIKELETELEIRLRRIKELEHANTKSSAH